MGTAVIELMADLSSWQDSEGRHPEQLDRIELKPNADPLCYARVVECHPPYCANGHPLVPPNYRGGWLPCTCAGPEHDRGHRVVGCGTCGHEWFYPPHTDRTASVEHWASAKAAQ